VSHFGAPFTFPLGGDPLDDADETTPGVQVLTRPVDGGGALDMYLDPITLDYVDTDDGEWLEVPDSRTIVLIQLEQRLGDSWESPGDGTAIKARLEDGEPVTPEFVQSETERAMQVLVSAGVISDLTVGPITDATGAYTTDDDGRFVLQTSWRDLASNEPIDLVYPAFER
jgi:hypothetical protein